MGIINPEPGAINNYLWVTAQEGIKKALVAVSAAQALENPKYAFDVQENMYRPTIEKEENKLLVNIFVASVVPRDKTSFGYTHIVTYNIDCYVRGKNEDDPDNPGSLVPADEVAVQRLQYLCSNVEYGLTNLETYYKELSVGQIVPKGTDLTFNPVDDSYESAEPYAPARFQFVCWFPYVPQDLTGLPVLNQSFIDLKNWAASIFRIT